MSPFPPPVSVPSDWSLQTMGLIVIVWVALVYAMLLWAEWRSARRTDRVHCPERNVDADIGVRLDYRDRPVDVISCSLLPGKVTCEKACVTLEPVAP